MFDENHRRTLLFLFPLSCFPCMISPIYFSLPSSLGYSTNPPDRTPFPTQLLFSPPIFFLFADRSMLQETDDPARTITTNSDNSRPKKPPSDHPQAAIKCPRCHSPNTKFCYYNNYSLTQPRHFCKSCRRYWTKEGALRNVPVGGGCRKNKKLKSSSRLPNSIDDSGSSNPEISRFSFFHGLSSSLCSTVHNAPVPGLYDHLGVSLNSLIPSGTGFSSLNVDTNLASSIESLSSINQDLHWKLQQQRLAMLFGGDDTLVNKNRGISSPIAIDDHDQELNPGLNLEISKPEEYWNSPDFNNARQEIVVGSRGGGDSAVADEWFFGDSYATTSMTAATADAPAEYNSGDSVAGCDGVQEWQLDLHQYSHLP